MVCQLHLLYLIKKALGLAQLLCAKKHCRKWSDTNHGPQQAATHQALYTYLPLGPHNTLDAPYAHFKMSKLRLVNNFPEGMQLANGRSVFPCFLTPIKKTSPTLGTLCSWCQPGHNITFIRGNWAEWRQENVEVLVGTALGYARHRTPYRKHPALGSEPVPPTGPPHMMTASLGQK